MFSTKINNEADYTYNSYLSDCDLINKYNLQNIYTKPQLKNIVVEFSIKNELNSSVSATIAASVLYIITNFYPFVTVKKSKSNDLNKLKNINTEYNFKIIFSNKQEINSFLSTLFVENWNTLLLDDFLLMVFEHVVGRNVMFAVGLGELTLNDFFFGHKCNFN